MPYYLNIIYVFGKCKTLHQPRYFTLLQDTMSHLPFQFCIMRLKDDSDSMGLYNRPIKSEKWQQNKTNAKIPQHILHYQISKAIQDSGLPSCIEYQLGTSSACSFHLTSNDRRCYNWEAAHTCLRLRSYDKMWKVTKLNSLAMLATSTS